MIMWCDICGAVPDKITWYDEISLVEWTCVKGHRNSRQGVSRDRKD